MRNPTNVHNNVTKDFSQKEVWVHTKKIYTDKRPHHCIHCNEQFTAKSSLTAHVKQHKVKSPIYVNLS